ncbi:MAG: hypothetical protein MR966_02645 [Lachnospiraceae bacterium]|nr:hypothetical protein [Lachnospiraceae bacterium]
MPDVRPLNAKYGISKYAFRTAYAYCLQYSEWKEELEQERSLISSPQFSEVAAGGCGGSSDRTAEMAVRRAELEKKLQRIESTAREAVGVHSSLYPYLLDYVTTEGATFAWLKRSGLPCERTLFYEIRRRFYWLMSKKI